MGCLVDFLQRRACADSEDVDNAGNNVLCRVSEMFSIVSILGDDSAASLCAGGRAPTDVEVAGVLCSVLLV